MKQISTTLSDRPYKANEYHCFYHEMKSLYSPAEVLQYLETMYKFHKEMNPFFLEHLQKALEYQVQKMNELIIDTVVNYQIGKEEDPDANISFLTLEKNFPEYNYVVKPALDWIAYKKKPLEPKESTKPIKSRDINPIELIQLKRTDSMSTWILFTIYNSLNTKCFNVPYFEFERHFIKNGEEFKKIIWESGEPEITHLFNELAKKTIVTRTPYKLITEHFIKKNGKPFSNKQLSTAYSNASDLNEYPIIHSLIDELEKLVLS